jgi:hypothetical protein
LILHVIAKKRIGVKADQGRFVSKPSMVNLRVPHGFQVALPTRWQWPRAARHEVWPQCHKDTQSRCLLKIIEPPRTWALIFMSSQPADGMEAICSALFVFKATICVPQGLPLMTRRPHSQQLHGMKPTANPRYTLSTRLQRPPSRTRGHGL